MTENDEGIQVPKFRLDQEAEKRRKAEEKAAELEGRLKALEEERDNEESEKDKKKGEFERIAERERKKREEAEAKREEAERERDEAHRNLDTYKRRVAFSSAARGVIRPEAIDDAFSMIPAEDFEGVDISNVEKVKKLAQGLAENKPYLAEAQKGAGSGGSDRPVLVGSDDAAKQPLPFGKFNKRRIN